MKKRFEILDVFRGIFAIIVCLYHFWPGPGFIGHTKFIRNGTYFTDFFFVLSGFVIYYNYSSLISFSKQKDFLLKRLLRLYPLHLFTLVVFLFFNTVKFLVFQLGIFDNPPFQANNLISFLAHLFLVQAYGFPINMPSWNAPSWSISAELFSYFIFVFTLKFIFRFSTLTKIFCFLIISLTFLCLIIVKQNGLPYIKLEAFGILRCGYSFFLGCIVSILYNSSASIIKPNYFIFSFLEILTLLLSIIGITYTVPSISYLVPVLFFITIYVFSFEAGSISKVLNKKFTHRLGILSYSIYMNNYLINSFFQIAFVKVFKLSNPIIYDFMIIPYLVFIVVMSHFTYEYIEVRGKYLLLSLLARLNSFFY